MKARPVVSTQTSGRSLHNASWFYMRNFDKVIHVLKGGRQGCRFGGKLSNIICAVALDLVGVEVQNVGITVNIHFSSVLPPWAYLANKSVATPATSASPMIDITYVDDAAFFVSASLPDKLLYRFETAVDNIYCL